MDQFYFESGYIETSYFVYTASAASSLSSTATVDCTVTRIKGAVVEISSAFTASMTVNASRDGDVDLTSTFTWSADGDVNRSAAIALSNIANLNAQAAKSVDVGSSMAVAFALTADAADVIQAQATFPAVTATLTTTKYFGDFVYTNGRPRTFSGGTYDSSVKKYGTHSLAGFVQDTFSSLTPSWSYDWQFEFWDKDIRDGCEIDLGFIYIIPFSSTDRRHIFCLRNGAGSVVAQSTSPTPSIGAFDHWAIVKTGNRVSYYLNGTRWYTLDFGGTQTLKASDTLLIGIGGTLSGGSPNRIDEVSLHIGDTFGNSATNGSITVPTAARDNTYSYTQGLWHFDNAGTDDTVLYERVTVSLNTQATQTATAIVSKDTSAALSLQATWSATALATKPGAADLSATFTQSTDSDRLVDAVSDQNAVFSQEAEALRTRPFDSALASEFTQTTLQSVTRDAVVDQAAAFTSEITIRATKVGDIDLDVVAELSATGAKTTGYASALASTATQSTDINVIRDAELAITEFIAAFDTTPTRVRLFESALSAEFAQTTDIDKFKEVTADLAAEFAQSTVATKTVEAVVSAQSEFAQATAADRTRTTTSSLSSSVDIAATATRTRPFVSDLSAEFAQSAAVAKTTGFESQLSVQATCTITAVKTVDVIVTQVSIATQITVVARRANVETVLESTFTQSTQASRTRELVEPTLSGLSSTLSQNPRVTITNAPVGGFGANQNGFVASIWFKRDTLSTSLYQTIWANGVQETSGNNVINGTSLLLSQRGGVTNLLDVVLRDNIDPDEFNATFYDAITNDLDWHHLLFWCEPTQAPAPKQFRLWVDGVLQEATQDSIPTRVNFDASTGVKLGQSVVSQFTGAYESTQSKFEGAFAQLWMGNVTRLNPSLFYDGGYVDLGSQGLGAFDQLPAPYVYNLLNAPYTGITWDQEGAETGAASELLAIPLFSAETRLTAISQAVLVVTANLTSQFQSTITAFKTVELQSALTSTASLTTATGVTRQGQSALASTAELATTAIYTAGAVSTQSAEFALTAEVGDLDSASAGLSATFALECSAILIEPTRASAELQVTATLTADAESLFNMRADLVSAFTVTADATLIPPVRAEANLSVSASMTVIIGAIEENIVLLVSAGTMTTDADKLADAFVTMPVTTTFTADVQRAFRTTSANLQVQGFQVTVGDIINLDPALTLTIKQEQRELIILPETRQFDLASETRTLIINKG